MKQEHPLSDLTALLGSRICHDLISPLGAIGNGVELLMMTGSTASPEVALISESVLNANARIRFFRVAFGAASPDQRIARSEVLGILGDLTRGGRLQIDWLATGDAPRPEVKLAFLLLQCLETALPFGGRIAVRSEGGAWQIVAEALRMKIDPLLWQALSAPQSLPADLTASQVQFALAPAEALRQDRRIAVASTADTLTLRF